MKRKALAALTLLGCSLLAPAAASVDFGGNWVLNTANSLAVDTPFGPIRLAEQIRTVRQRGNILQVQDRSTYRTKAVRTYIVDGTERSNRDEDGDDEFYTARWHDDRLIIEHRGSKSIPIGVTNFSNRVEWVLAQDRKTLTITIIPTTPGLKNRQGLVLVYNRQAP